MTAVDILKQSLNFYGRVFNKVFWLSVASSIMPLLMVAFVGGGQPSILGMLLVMVLSMFFSIYMLVFVHQFSKDQDDSLAAGFQLTLKKFFPVILTSMVFGLVTMLSMIPGAIVGSVLASGIQDEQLQAGLIAIIAMIPMSFFLYRCFFAIYFTLTDGTSPIDALKASNQLTKKNKLIFRGFMLLTFIMLAYFVLLVLVGQMIAFGTMAIAILEFALQVIVMPLFTIFIYRMYEVAKEQYATKSKNGDIDSE
ncbi:hypothetical protein NBRC116188_18910 [Oceaniserpentilla sp. 4NH20-0058]|uniref:hypothetical protein n=1 Tax=Oceaniserpentilla sp. 4NH20-0058 TaxID=3127660 RepID=UPI0031085424